MSDSSFNLALGKQVLRRYRELNYKQVKLPGVERF